MCSYYVSPCEIIRKYYYNCIKKDIYVSFFSKFNILKEKLYYTDFDYEDGNKSTYLQWVNCNYIFNMAFKKLIIYPCEIVQW